MMAAGARRLIPLLVLIACFVLSRRELEGNRFRMRPVKGKLINNLNFKQVFFCELRNRMAYTFKWAWRNPKGYIVCLFRLDKI